jgi:hypothetical protein
MPISRFIVEYFCICFDESGEVFEELARRKLGYAYGSHGFDDPASVARRQISMFSSTAQSEGFSIRMKISWDVYECGGLLQITSPRFKHGAFSKLAQYRCNGRFEEL